MSIAHSIPKLRLLQNLTLKIKGQGHGWGHTSKSKWGSNILSTDIPFTPCQSALPFLRYSIFKIWPWKSRVKVKRPWCCTTTGPDNRTSNGVNPSRDFRDMGSASYDPSAAWFDKFLAHGLAHMGQIGKLLWQCTTTGLDKSMKL